jgi:outer membrane protein assembly factor BamD (BamD/ComL family)
MATTDSHSSASTALFRIVAMAVLFLSITACGLQVLAGINAMQHPDPSVPVAIPTLFIPAILSLIAGIALSTLLEGVARLVAVQPPEAADSTASQVNLMMTIAELQSSLPTLIGEAVQQAVAQIQIPEAESPSISDPNVQQHLERLVKLMEEMKELSMLDETQRQTRRKQTMLRRKNSRLEEVASLIQQGSWAQADALLHLLESLHPGDADVLAHRNQMDDARILHQANEWDQLTQQVNDQLALSQYSEAIDGASQFLERYPTHSEAQQLLQRIRQEQRIYIENLSGRLYEEIKSAVENRQWRTALDGIQQFLERYPDNVRADKIRKQIRVIQKNAEIEERHEQEDRIKDLINEKRFTEAADLSEDLLSRFPDSPQAAYLSDLLPKLREKSSFEEPQDIIT